MRRRVAVSLAPLAAGAALAAGLAQPHVSVAADTPKGGTLRIGSFVDVDFVDPALGYTMNAGLIADATCARLFEYRAASDATGGRVTPNVVRSFSVSRDGRTYSFRLQETFRFHTGARVTARSFADALDRDADPRLPSPAKAFLHEIVGADAVIGGTAASISGIRVLDRFQLEVRLTKRVEDFPARLTLAFFCPILPDTRVDPRGIDDPAGSGPYYVAERIRNQRVVLKRNPYYRGNRPANVDEMVWTIGGTLRDCQRAVEEDRLDFCGEVSAPSDAWRALAERYGVNRPDGQVFASPSHGTWYFAFNHTRPAFAGRGQIPLKKAINFAIDRPALARTLGFLAVTRTDQMLPAALTRPAGIYPLGGADVAAARRWYAKARRKPRTLVLYTWNRPPQVAMAEVLAFNLRQLGIDLDVEYFDVGAVFEKATTPGEPFDLVLGGWVADYPDPWGFFGSLLDPRVGPLRLTVDPQVLRRMEEANRLPGAARSSTWAEIDVDLMRNDPPWAPFAHHQNLMLVSRSVGCFRRTPIFAIDITALCKR